MQNKPNLLDTQMNVNFYLTKHYENARLRGREKNKPNQTQFPKSHRLKFSRSAVETTTSLAQGDVFDRCKVV